MARNVFAKNVTASGVQIPDLSGIYIEPYSERDLREYFSLDDIDYSLDLREAIEAGLIVLNDGEKDLTTEESLDISSVPTFYELPDTIIEMTDTPVDYDEGKFLRSTVSGTEWATVSGITGAVSVINYNSDHTESSTTSTVYQHKLRLDIDPIPAGEYMVKWYYEWQYKHGSFEFLGRIQLDDTTDIMNHNSAPANVSSWYPVSGFIRETLTAGSHYIDIDYCGSASGKESKIRSAHLELWRV
jgi:hypothetical protein